MFSFIRFLMRQWNNTKAVDQGTQPPTIFDRVALFGLSCMVLLWLFVFFATAVSWLLRTGEGFRLVGRVTVFCLVIGFLLSAAILWFRSLYWLFRYWKNRETMDNLGLLAFSIVIPVVSAFFLHYLQRRRRDAA